jgi:hypothetical protein
MTATPRIFTTRVKKRAKELEYELASMDDESLFGPEFHVLTFDRAIRRGLLADYRVAIIGATNTEMKELAQQGVIVRTRSIQHNAWILAAQIGLAKAMKKYDLRSLITFHSSITKARCFTDVNRPDSLPSTIENMSEDFRPGGQIWSTHISHKMPTSKRKQFLQKLGNLPEKTRGIIGNFACLGEGVDVPALDGVAFIDPKQSQIAIVQAVGRAIRKPDKSKAKTATVVIPVFVEDHDDEESALSSSSFKSVWAVLNALRAHDTRLGEELDQMRLKHRRQELGGKPRLPEKIEIDLPKKIKFGDFEGAFAVRTVLRTTLTPRLTIGMILEWADSHYERHGEYPKMTSGVVEDVLGENWLAIDGALVQGLRGLTGGTTLARLLDEERGVPNIQDLPALSVKWILKKADEHFAEHKAWPTSESGKIKGSRETWLGVDAALRKGSRGLPKGSSLSQLLKKERGRRSHMDLPKLSEKLILECADAYFEKHGKYPNKDSGPVEGMPDETWNKFNSALSNGVRGLSGGSSLARLLKEKRGQRIHMHLPDLTEEQIIEWAKAFHEEALKLPKQKWPKSTWPTKQSGPVKDAPGETWLGVDAALRRGNRGLPGDSSLSKLLAPLKK